MRSSFTDLIQRKFSRIQLDEVLVTPKGAHYRCPSCGTEHTTEPKGPIRCPKCGTLMLFSDDVPECGDRGTGYWSSITPKRVKIRRKQSKPRKTIQGVKRVKEALQEAFFRYPKIFELKPPDMQQAPWEMKPDEFADFYRRLATDQNLGRAASYVYDMEHLKIVKAALKKGKRVPKEVLHFYRGDPDIARQRAAWRPKLSSRLKSKANRTLSTLSSYFPSLDKAVEKISEALRRKHGIVIVDSDGTPFQAIFTGRQGNTSIEIAPAESLGYQKEGAYKSFTDSVLFMTWYRMDSGRYEIVCYLS